MRVATEPNPYHFGSPADDLHFTDRAAELSQLRTLMLNGQNLVLIAPRRYGKSSLLSRAVREVQGRGGRSGRVSLIRCSSERDVAEALMRAVLAGPLGWLPGRTRELGRRVRRLRFNPEITIDPGSGALGVSFGPNVKGVNWQEVITDVVRLLDSAGDAHHPVSMVLDEFQKAYEISPSIPDLMKDLVDELPRVSLVFAGSKRHLMEAMTADPERGALYNVGDKLYLAEIPLAEFVEYLVERAGAGGKHLSGEVAAGIYETALGVPNDVQLLAFWAYELAGATIDQEALGRAIRAAVAGRKAEFEAIFEALSLSQQRLLKLIARQPLAHFSAAEVQQELGVSHTAARNAGETLRRLDLIQRRAEAWSVSGGLMRRWLLEGAD